MTLDSWIALGVLAITVVVLVTDRFPAAIVLGGAVAAMLFAGVVDADIALSGFSATAPWTIACLYIVAGAATASGLLNGIVDKVLRSNGSVGLLAATTAGLSGFIPNTPLIAVFAPQVVRWSDRNGVSVSRYLMPLSFASILGGVITVIGTSTNLVVSDLLEVAGEEPLGVFEITVIGLPVAILGVVVLSVVGVRLLPDRSQPTTSIGSRARQFQIAMRIDPSGPLVGRTVEEAGLRDLAGAYLSFVERRENDAAVAIAATPETTLIADDICCFVGDVNRVVDLHDVEGLVSTENAHIDVAAGAGTRVYEAVVAPLSALVGASLRTAGFRGRYGGAVMAVHREGEELGGQLGRISLRAGDVLLVLADSDFERRWRGHTDFSLVAGLDAPGPARRARAPFVAAILAVFIGVASTGMVSLFEAAVAAAIAVIAVGVLSVGEAGRAIDVNVILTMAIAIGLGGAISASGLAAEAAGVIERVDWLGDRGLVLVTILVTILLSELLTNTAAAALMLPIALAVAADVGAEPRMLAITVLFGASCSFLSPVGYQTNLMVAGLGGYRFSDFARVGAPLTLTMVLTVTTLAPVFFG